jgi:hypothetical protein
MLTDGQGGHKDKKTGFLMGRTVDGKGDGITNGRLYMLLNRNL